MPTECDVVVVGAGPGGSSAAAFLARAGLNVVLLDKAEFPRDKTCGDLLSPIGIHVLAKLGLGPGLEQAGFAVRSGSLTAPDRGTVRWTVRARPPYPAYAYVIRRFVLDDLVLGAAVRAGASFRGQVRVSSVREDDGGQFAFVEGEVRGRKADYRARLVVLAVGANSPLLRQLGMLRGKPSFGYAARVYFEDIRHLIPEVSIRFDGVPLPGGGWIFPISADAANVGAGFFARSDRTPTTAAQALARFLMHPPIHDLLSGATQVAPIKAFPLRMDFHRSRVVGPRLLLVGEAAGLVNPLTGEGIHYAVESAEMASACILRCFELAEFSRRELLDYERTLRSRFQRLFVGALALRKLYMNSRLINPMVRLCRQSPRLTERMAGVLLSYEDPIRMLHPGVILLALRHLRTQTSRGRRLPRIAGE